jgi:hypothetical protein
MSEIEGLLILQEARRSRTGATARPTPMFKRAAKALHLVLHRRP